MDFMFGKKYDEEYEMREKRRKAANIPDRSIAVSLSEPPKTMPIGRSMSSGYEKTALRDRSMSSS